MGFLIEHVAGAFPFWLAPVQVVLVPIADRHLDYAGRQADYLRSQGFRVEVDSRPERMQAKIRDAELQKVPFAGVVGDRDQEAGTISLRDNRGDGDKGPMAPDAIVEMLRERVASRG